MPNTSGNTTVRDITHIERPSSGYSEVYGAMEIPVYYVNCYTGDDNNLGTSFGINHLKQLIEH